jgi:PDZ domain
MSNPFDQFSSDFNAAPPPPPEAYSAFSATLPPQPSMNNGPPPQYGGYGAAPPQYNPSPQPSYSQSPQPAYVQNPYGMPNAGMAPPPQPPANDSFSAYGQSPPPQGPPGYAGAPDAGNPFATMMDPAADPQGSDQYYAGPPLQPPAPEGAYADPWGGQAPSGPPSSDQSQYGMPPSAYGAPPQQPGGPEPYGAVDAGALVPSQQPSNPYAQQVYGQPPNPYGQPPSAYGQPPSPYGQPPNPYGQPPNPYSQPPNPYGQPPNPYGQPPNPYGQPPNPYGQYQQPPPPPPVDPFSVFESSKAPEPARTSTALVPATATGPNPNIASDDDFFGSFSAGAAPEPAEQVAQATKSPRLAEEEKKGDEGLPPGGEWYDARIFTPTLGVMFFKPQELTDSLFLNTEKSIVSGLGDRPVVAFIVEGSSARSAGVELGHVLLKVNGVDVRNPKDASRLIKEGPRPLPLLFYVPNTDVVVAEGEHMVKYDTKETTAPNSAKEWKPKYVVIGGIISQPWMMNMYRSKVCNAYG